jgi:hypothetical protein
MVEHVGKRSKNVCLDSINKETEYTTTHHISSPAKVSELVLSEVRTSSKDAIIVSFEIEDLLMDLHQKW